MSALVHTLLGRDLDAPLCLDLRHGRVVAYTHRAPDRPSGNEDAALVLGVDGERALLVVADGMGGLSAGERASCAAVEALQDAVMRSLREARAFREAILTGFEEANAAVVDLRAGAGTTLTAVEIDGRGVRAYHVGDSEVLVVGQRGKRKLQIITHSPVGYALEAGLIDEREALAHEDRHIVSNALGGADMRVEMSPRLRLADRDTVLVASDGLFDNLHSEEVVERIRRGPLTHAADRLVETARSRMQHPREGRPSKADDLTFLLYRPGHSAR